MGQAARWTFVTALHMGYGAGDPFGICYGPPTWVMGQMARWGFVAGLSQGVVEQVTHWAFATAPCEGLRDNRRIRLSIWTHTE